MPRLFQGAETIPDLTWPDADVHDRLTIDLGEGRGELVLQYCGRGHTEGDIVAWLPQPQIVFAGDLVESQAALYTGDAYHAEWSTSTLDRVADLGARMLVGGRGEVARGPRSPAPPSSRRGASCSGCAAQVGDVHDRNGTLEEAFAASHQALGARLRRLADLRALPAVRRRPPVGRARRHRAAPHLDRGPRPRDLGAAAVVRPTFAVVTDDRVLIAGPVPWR